MSISNVSGVQNQGAPRWQATLRGIFPRGFAVDAAEGLFHCDVSAADSNAGRGNRRQVLAWARDSLTRSSTY
jgi:hypothetical protein